MSRSYRKPWYTDGYKGSKTKQFMKRLSNKIIRRTEDVPNGKAYRKMSVNPWDLCDYRYPYDPYPMIVIRDGVLVAKDPPPIWRVARK